MEWFGLEGTFKDHLVWAGTSSTRGGCSRPNPTWRFKVRVGQTHAASQGLNSPRGPPAPLPPSHEPAACCPVLPHTPGPRSPSRLTLPSATATAPLGFPPFKPPGGPPAPLAPTQLSRDRPPAGRSLPQAAAGESLARLRANGGGRGVGGGFPIQLLYCHLRSEILSWRISIIFVSLGYFFTRLRFSMALIENIGELIRIYFRPSRTVCHASKLQSLVYTTDFWYRIYKNIFLSNFLFHSWVAKSVYCSSISRKPLKKNYASVSVNGASSVKEELQNSVTS